MAAQLNLQDYLYKKNQRSPAPSDVLTTSVCNSRDKDTLVESDVESQGDSDNGVKDARKDRDPPGHVRPASTAVRPGEMANFGPGWSPDMFADMLKQQQDMLKTMATLLPRSGNTRGEETDSESLSTPPAKRSRISTSKSEGEISENEDTVDRDFDNFVASGNSGEESDPYENISAFFHEEEKLGKEVADPTAKLVNSALRSVISVAKEKELVSNVLRPANCEALSVPRVNVEVWREIRKEARDADGSVQRVQTLLHKGLGPLVTVMDTLRSRKEKVLVSQLGEAFRLLALASSRLSQKRKDQLAPELDPAIRSICVSSRPVSSLLFGDDLPKTLKDIRDSKQVGAKVTSTAYRYRPRGRQKYRPGAHSGQSYRQEARTHNPRGRGSFLGKRGQQNQRYKAKQYKSEGENQNQRRQ